MSVSIQARQRNYTVAKTKVDAINGGLPDYQEASREDFCHTRSPVHGVGAVGTGGSQARVSVLALDFLWRSFSQALVQADLQGPAGMEDVFPTRSWHPVDS